MELRDLPIGARFLKWDGRACTLELLNDSRARIFLHGLSRYENVSPGTEIARVLDEDEFENLRKEERKNMAEKEKDEESESSAKPSESAEKEKGEPEMKGKSAKKKSLKVVEGGKNGKRSASVTKKEKGKREPKVIQAIGVGGVHKGKVAKFDKLDWNGIKEQHPWVSKMTRLRKSNGDDIEGFIAFEKAEDYEAYRERVKKAKEKK